MLQASFLRLSTQPSTNLLCATNTVQYIITALQLTSCCTPRCTVTAAEHNSWQWHQEVDDSSLDAWQYHCQQHDVRSQPRWQVLTNSSAYARACLGQQHDVRSQLKWQVLADSSFSARQRLCQQRNVGSQPRWQVPIVSLQDPCTAHTTSNARLRAMQQQHHAYHVTAAVAQLHQDEQLGWQLPQILQYAARGTPSCSQLLRAHNGPPQWQRHCISSQQELQHSHNPQHQQQQQGQQQQQQQLQQQHHHHRLELAEKHDEQTAAAEGGSHRARHSIDPFLDRVRMTAAGGHGGRGAVSYTRVSKGRYLAAAGGDGAPGGNVVFQAVAGLFELRNIPRHAKGGAGGAGGRNGRRGAVGEDCIVRVPVGTQVYELPPVPSAADTTGSPDTAPGDIASNAKEPAQSSSLQKTITSSGSNNITNMDEAGDDVPRTRLLCELMQDGQQVVVARGGQGGYGNQHFQQPGPNKPPSDRATTGSAGMQAELLLELKLLADVGFVGMPNAGKSSLLSALTAARAKVGSYAFTTVRPQLGTIVYEDEPAGIGSHSAESQQHLQHPRRLRYLTVADIPGLIEGAHHDRGRGNAFLRHVERVRCVLYVVDLSGGQPGSLVPMSAAQQLQILQAELSAYHSLLSHVPAVVAANKLDACHKPHQVLQQLAAATRNIVVPVSATHCAGLAQLKQVLHTVVSQPAAVSTGMCN